MLLLTDRIDEWVAAHLHEFEGKTLANVASSAADVASAIETPEKAAAESAFKNTMERLGKVLSGKIASAQVSSRLTDSPAVLVAGEFGMSLRMGRILKQAGQKNPFATLPILELNPKHPLALRLQGHRRRGGLRGFGPCALRPSDAGGRRRARRSGDLRPSRQSAHRRRACRIAECGAAENHSGVSMLTPQWAANEDPSTKIRPTRTTHCSMRTRAR